MVISDSTIQRRSRTSLYNIDTSASCDSTATVSYYDDTIYYTCSSYNSGKYEALIRSIKSRKIYPWELEAPVLKFIKKIKAVYLLPIFNRKIFINAYKSARSTIAKFN